MLNLCLYSILLNFTVMLNKICVLSFGIYVLYIDLYISISYHCLAPLNSFQFMNALLFSSVELFYYL